MKKLFLQVVLAAILICSFALVVSAKSAYLEEIPENLKNGENDAATHFIVFDGEEYYSGGSGIINALATSVIEEQITALYTSNGVLASEVGTKYLTKFIFPATFGGAELKKVDFNTNQLKGSTYFKHICGAVVLPSTVTTVTDMNDSINQLRYFDFGENSQVTSIPYCFCQSAKKLRQIENFPRNLESIGNQAFANSYYAFSGEIYINAKSIGYKAFDNAVAYVTGIVFGEDVTSIADQAMSCGETSIPQTKYIEFQCDVTKLTIQESLDSTKGAFYFGLKSVNQRKPLNNLVCIVLSNPAQANVENGTSFQNVIGCDVFFNANATNPVVTSHNYQNSTATYENFFKNGKAESVCRDCGCETTVELLPIFKDLGYSCSKTGVPSVTFGISIDYKVLEYYNLNAETEKELANFGLLVAVKDSIGNTAFNSDMTVKAGCINIGFDKFNGYSYAEIKIVNLSGEKDGKAYDYTGLDLFLTAYFEINGEIKYYDNGEISSTLNTSVTYNSVLANSN